MGARTKIIVLHMKEIIYTAVFAVLGILLILLLMAMFFPGKPKKPGEIKKPEKIYTPGVYTAGVTLNNTGLEVEVSVDESRINSIRLLNLDEAVAAMLPLVQPAIEDLAGQIYEKQSLADIRLSDDMPYTSQVILDTIKKALKKAAR